MIDIDPDDPHADVKKHALTPEVRAMIDRAYLEKKAKAKAKRASRPNVGFVKVPLVWAERLAQARYIGTYRVALWVLYLHWKRKAPTFPLANGELGGWGVSRWVKHRALSDLERLGLIRVEWRSRKSPIVTIVKGAGP
jgi:hypothetical protein